MLVRSWWLCLALFIGMPLLIFYQISIIYWMYALSAFYIVKLRAWTTQLSRMSVQIVLGCCEIWTLHNTYFKTNVDSIHKIWSMSSSFFVLFYPCLSKEKNIALLSGLVIIISLRVLFCPACITFIFSIICLQQTDNAVHGAWMIPVSPKVIYPNKQKLGFCVCIHLLPITPVCNMYSINISSKIKVIRLLAKAKLWFKKNVSLNWSQSVHWWLHIWGRWDEVYD